jgi:hypothetical protein
VLIEVSTIPTAYISFLNGSIGGFLTINILSLFGANNKDVNNKKTKPEIIFLATLVIKLVF